MERHCSRSKGVHTLIFLGELSAIAWLVVPGLLTRRDRTAAAAAMVAGEAAVLWRTAAVTCSALLAERYEAARGSVSDIFLPDVARTIPIWASALGAYSNGLALALPQVVMARPEGVGRATRGPEAPE